LSKLFAKFHAHKVARPISDVHPGTGGAPTRAGQMRWDGHLVQVTGMGDVIDRGGLCPPRRMKYVLRHSDRRSGITPVIPFDAAFRSGTLYR